VSGRIMASSGIDLATFRLVEQCLNQLRHLVPLVDGKISHHYIHKIYMFMVLTIHAR
jgi:hypothetical protein